MDKPLHRIIITGEAANATAVLLRMRLSKLDNGDSVAVYMECDPATVDANDFVYRLGAHDTPAFAVEKILDQLADRGWITIDTGELSPEEEEQIRARLQGLGYID